MGTGRKRGVSRNVSRPWWALVLGAVAIVSVPLLGHHSFAVYYIESDTIEIEGDVIEFQYKNPHAWVQVVGEEAFGQRKAYAAEWTSTSALERAGITKDTLHVGDHVRIWASPNRNLTDNRVRLKRIERPSDRWKWGQTGRQTR